MFTVHRTGVSVTSTLHFTSVFGEAEMIQQKIKENLDRIHTRIESAAIRAGRSADSIHLVAVTKYAEKKWVEALFEAGQRDFGESRPQQMARRAEEFSSEIRWHLIGHLQRNKVDLILPVAEQIHSVDSVRLARKLSESAVKIGKNQPVLMEVNVSGEAAKDGLNPSELREQFSQVVELPNLQVNGLMTMAPRTNEPESTREVFQTLRELRDDLATDSLPLTELSMGMSGDFEVAIEEGATFVRVGSSLFNGLEREE